MSALEIEVGSRRSGATSRNAGPLVAVCALCGGAGASTVAYLTARSVARDTRARVLVCDTGGPTNGLALYAGVRTTRSLAGVANAVAAHEPLAEALFEHAPDGLRVMASGPALNAPADAHGLGLVLRDARAAHALTVVDCGLPCDEASRFVLASASHVVWVLPAGDGGLRRAWPLLQLFGLDESRHEIVVARADADATGVPLDALRQLADSRQAPLVLMPHVPDLAREPAEHALGEAALTLDAIRMAVSR